MRTPSSPPAAARSSTPTNVDALKRSGVVVYLQDESGRARRSASRPTRATVRSCATVGATASDLRSASRSCSTQRTPIYESVADHVVACDGRKPDEIADDIVQRLDRRGAKRAAREGRARPAVHRRRRTRAPRLGPRAREAPRGGRERVIVSPSADPQAVGRARSRTSLRAAGLDVTWCTFPAGEEQQDVRDVRSGCSRAMAKAGLAPRRRRLRARRRRRRRRRRASSRRRTPRASPSSRCRRRCSRWSTRRSAARPA